MKAFFDVVLGQSELLGSWALAVLGGGVAIIGWYVRNPVGPTPTLRVRWLVLVILAMFLELGSIMAMYLGYGQLTNVMLGVLPGNINSADEFYCVLEQHGFDEARLLFEWQFGLFFSGVILLVVFALRNYSLLTK